MAGIQDLMVTDVVTASPSDKVVEVARRMARNRIGAVLILQDGELWGLFSERDLLTRVIQNDRDPKLTAVGDVTTRELVTIDVDAPLRSVLRVFREHKFRHLPVVRSGKVVGILSTRDFLQFLVEGLERYIEDYHYRRDLAQGVDPYDHLGGAYGV